MRTFDDLKKELIQDPEFVREYEALAPEFAVMNAMLRARIEKGLTQKELS